MSLLTPACRLIVSFAVALAPAAAQCCLGAQDSHAQSPGGEFHVDARSTLGTGHAVHGPYTFEFVTWRTTSTGGRVELGRFERTWDTRAHFFMQVFVSPTGNGFLLDTSLEPALVFLAPDGTELRRVRSASKGAIWPDETITDPLCLRVFAAWDGHGGHRCRLWLPLATMVGPEEVEGPRETGRPKAWRIADGAPCWPMDRGERDRLRQALHWSPAQGEREAAAARAAMDEWLAKDTAAMEDAVVAFGLSAVPVLRARIAAEPALAPRLQSPLARIRSDLCGHDEPWRDLALLVAMLGHPDAELAADARSQLQRVLPAGALPNAEWVAAHREDLVWDLATDRHALRAVEPTKH